MTGISRIARSIGEKVRLAAVGMAAALIAILGVVVVDASPAAAASSCGRTCDGKDPQYYAWQYVGPSPGTAQFCASDASTIASTAKVELRYSKSCRTAWARATGEPAVGAVWHVEVRSYNASGSARTTKGTSPYNNGWSLMVDDAGITAKACVIWRYSADDPDEYSSCTKAL